MEQNTNKPQVKKPNNIISIPTSLDGDFFRYWFEFLAPFHRLTEREIDVITEFTKERYRLSKLISDEEILDKVLMSDDTKKAIRDKCNMTVQHFQVILSKLRKTQVILDNKINPRFIPNITEEQGAFKLLLHFSLK